MAGFCVYSNIRFIIQIVGWVGMSVRERALIFWLLVGVLLVAGMIWLRPILLPFVAGAVIAYALNPIADRLERLGLSRMFATLMILFVFSMVTLIILVTALPFLVREASDFATALPDHMNNFREFVGHYYKSVFGKEMTDIEFGFEDALRRFASSSSLKLGTFLKHLWDGSLALVNMISLFVITPVVSFYLLLDWNKLVSKVDGWLPREHLTTLRGLAAKIDRTLNGFMRGQVTVCFILAVIYSTGLMLVGLKHGFLIGVIAGVLSFMPYIGSAIGLLLSFGMAVGQFWPEWVPILMVLGVFATGQLIEGNFLQPKIVGDQVNLHPVWLIFALFVFGYLMGFVGMLVAVPLAATIGVLVRFGLDRYLNSDLYRGKNN